MREYLGVAAVGLGMTDTTPMGYLERDVARTNIAASRALATMATMCRQLGHDLAKITDPAHIGDMVAAFGQASHHTIVILAIASRAQGAVDGAELSTKADPT